MFSKFPWVFGRAQASEPVPCNEPEADCSDRTVGGSSLAAARRREGYGPVRQMRLGGLTVTMPDKFGDELRPVIHAIAAVRAAGTVPPDVLARTVAQCLSVPRTRCRGGRCGR